MKPRPISMTLAAMLLGCHAPQRPATMPSMDAAPQAGRASARAHEEAWLGFDRPAESLLDQSDFHDMACGPTSLVMALRLGNAAGRRALAEIPGANAIEQLQTLCDDLGAKPSVSYERGNRWRPRSGMAPRDLLQTYNDVLTKAGAPRVAGGFLSRESKETDTKLVRRVHARILKSIRKGRPPVVRLRSFAPAAENGKLVWTGRIGHYIVVTGVPQRLQKDALGFAFDYVDPDGGIASRSWVHVPRRNFTAAQGNTKKWKWLRNRPYLLVANSRFGAMRTTREAWHRRVTITFDYAICAR